MEKKDIAVIGMSGIYPGADSVSGFYKNLLDKKDCITQVPQERLELTRQAPDKKYFELGYLKDIDKFDYDFFNLSAREASFMDPQQRLALQEACKTIWNSGYSLKQFRGSRTSVVLGCGDSGYERLTEECDGVVKIGNLKSVIAGRIAYQLDLKGLAYVLDTSCSSSLMAIHQGCSHLRSGEADYVLAGGVSLTVLAAEEEIGKNNPLGIASQSYRTRTFDEKSDGTGGGEGCSFVLLKRLEDAVRDNDYIYAVIKGSSANQDGGASNSVAAPSPSAQTEVIVDAWKKAEVDPETITYIEAHGTGTKIGDPIEIQGLTDAYNQYTEKKGFCKISAVKSNIGHTGYHAGVASFMKAVLAVYHKKKLPLIHFERPNPMIHFETSAVIPCTEVEEWKSEIRRAGISSFGLSGTNVHVVIEQAPSRKEAERKKNTSYPFVISARTEEGVCQYAKELGKWLKTTSFDLANIAYTQCTGRDFFAYRKVIFAASKEELRQKLYTVEKPAYAKEKKEMLLLCSGDADFKKEILLNWLERKEMKEELAGMVIDSGQLEKKAVRTVLGQVMLYQQWKNVNVKVKTIVGCGAGNITVAYALKNISLREAIKKACDYTEQAALNQEAFLGAMKKAEHKELLFVELGEKGILSTLIKEKMVMASVINGCQEFNEAVGSAVEAGMNLDMGALFHGAGRKVPIYPYLFEKKKCWLEKIVTQNRETVLEQQETSLNEKKATTQEMVREIWEEVLGFSQFNEEDDFFDIGGNSLMAMQVIDRIAEYRKVELEFDDLYTYNTVAALAEYIDSQAPQEEEKPVELSKEKALSYQQESMLLLYKQNKNSNAYNMPAMIRLKGKVEKEALFKAMNAILKKHEVLQTIYKEKNGVYVPFIQNDAELPVIYEDLSQLPDKEQLIREKQEEMMRTTFALETEIPVKMKLIRTGEEEYYLMLIVHHIAADGWSVGIIFNELAENYKKLKNKETIKIEKNEMDYGEYAARNKQLLEAEQGKEKLNYWVKSLADIPEYLDFPTDKKRPEIMLNYGDNYGFHFREETKLLMDEFCKEHNVTSYVLLYSAYCVLLYRYSGQNDFCIGSPVANRRGLKEEKIIGFFANTLALHEVLDGTESFLDYVLENKAKLTEALRNQEIPLEYIVKNLKIKRSASYAPVFQYGFVLQNLGNTFHLDGLEAEFLELSQQYSKFEMLLSLSLSQTEFSGRIEYSTELFTEETIMQFAESYQMLLENCMNNPKQSLDEIEITNAARIEETEDYDF